MPHPKEAMKKTTAAVVTVLSLSLAIGLSACSSPAPSGSPQQSHQGKQSRTIKAQGEGVVGAVKERKEAEATPEAKEVKATMDDFYASIANKDKAKKYSELTQKLNQDKALTLEQRNAKGQEFFAEDMKRFDLEKISKDDAFYLLSVSTLAAALVDKDYPKITVPVDAITVKGNLAVVNMNRVGAKDPAGATTPAGTVQLVKKEGKWLISVVPGVK